MTIEDLKALLEDESGVPVAQQALFFNGSQLVNLKKTLEEYGFGESEMIHLQRQQQQQQQPQQQQASGAHDFDVMRQHVLRDANLLSQLESTNPELAQAARNDPAKFSSMVQQIEQTRRSAEAQKAQLAVSKKKERRKNNN
ncbi:hypothetical protein K501DRAFT_203507 [Backusella circina FSU 941]|nr:hypothetical protein K501DRAFT_203507 [Backusella circina FSU 941]